MNARRAGAPYPGPLQASLLTLLGAFLAALVAVTAGEVASPTTALGLGAVLGLGAAGALGATSVPPPHAERVGLRGLRARHLLPLVLLLPVALVASELDNVVQAWLPAPDAPLVAEQTLERLPTGMPLALVETLVVAVGLVPLVEEWFFRGVLQQGLVAALGAFWGVVVTALLFALGHGSPGISPQTWLAVVAQSLLLGLVFGFARHKTGSLLASVFLHVGVNLAGVLALAGAARVAIPGYNAPGAHTPPAVLLPALGALAAGLWLLAREAPPPLPEAPAGIEDLRGDPEE